MPSASGFVPVELQEGRGVGPAEVAVWVVRYACSVAGSGEEGCAKDVDRCRVASPSAHPLLAEQLSACQVQQGLKGTVTEGLGLVGSGRLTHH